MAVYDRLRPLLFSLDPETAHDLTMMALRPVPAPNKLTQHDPALATVVAGIKFPSPLGLAAGFDKDARGPGQMLRFGFGFVEVGTVTPEPQPGNQGPRAFRSERDEAIINRFGFNSRGHAHVRKRLARRQGKPGIVGVNLGANRDSEDKIADYVAGVHAFSEFAAYLTVNISSPNTKGLRDLQHGQFFAELVSRVVEARDEVGGPPIFLKVSPDLEAHEISSIAKTAMLGKVDALIVSNTTTSRPEGLEPAFAAESGGLSGKPLKELALEALRAFRTEVGQELPIIGVGGIGSAEDAYERIRAGASLIQLYTALVFRGPALAWEINDGLVRLLKQDGFLNIAEAVGIDVRSPAKRPAAA